MFSKSKLWSNTAINFDSIVTHFSSVLNTFFFICTFILNQTHQSFNDLVQVKVDLPQEGFLPSWDSMWQYISASVIIGFLCNYVTRFRSKSCLVTQNQKNALACVFLNPAERLNFGFFGSSKQLLGCVDFKENNELCHAQSNCLLN